MGLSTAVGNLVTAGLSDMADLLGDFTPVFGFIIGLVGLAFAIRLMREFGGF